jgi:hypothetical protein
MKKKKFCEYDSWIIFNLILFCVTYKESKMLEGSSLEGLFSLVQCLWVRLGVYPRGEHLKGVPQKDSGLTRKHYTRLERPDSGNTVTDLHNCKLKKGLHRKTFYVFNKFHNIVS